MALAYVAYLSSRLVLCGYSGSRDTPIVPASHRALSSAWLVSLPGSPPTSRPGHHFFARPLVPRVPCAFALPSCSWAALRFPEAPGLAR